MSTSESDVGGVKEVIATIEGRGAYSKLKYESGVHRVQRVPATEASGRIHTSTVTVAVLPEAEEVDVQIDPKDLRIDTFCSSGPGGQSVNTTYSAVRITHIPTNTVVSQQDEKSQIKNKAKAMRVLRSRLYEMEMRKQQEAIAKDRRSQVGTGERSEKIRTYNFRENRITDHRVNFTTHQLAEVLNAATSPSCWTTSSTHLSVGKTEGGARRHATMHDDSRSGAGRARPLHERRHQRQSRHARRRGARAPGAGVGSRALSRRPQREGDRACSC